MFLWKNLDAATRKLMEQEINDDNAAGKLFLSTRLTPAGIASFATNLKAAAQAGTEVTLATTLRGAGQLKTHETKQKPSGGTTEAKVPVTAAQTLAEGEFNRFYMRAVCLRAIASGTSVRVYRAKQVERPREGSEAKIGMIVDPKQLLSDLRSNIGIETFLGIPGGPNSGLSIELV